jgi:hypothetical protein
MIFIRFYSESDNGRIAGLNAVVIKRDGAVRREPLCIFFSNTDAENVNDSRSC